MESQVFATPVGPAAGRTVYSVSRLNREARRLLEDQMGRLWVQGEIADLADARSGHAYFVLKEGSVQVRCVLFQDARARCCRPVDGLLVLAKVRVTLYEGRGQFQLVIDEMEDAGEGSLRRAFEALKQRLETEGLFAADRKRPLPAHVRRLGIITSPDGAALHDILTTLQRRFPGIAVLLYPVPVQGPEAAARIAETLALASARGECDVLLLARGGGSLTDLWAFNEEIVARAIIACTIPVVTGVGHETDFTIADLVADRRAATPTAAAELLSPDQALFTRRLRETRARLQRLCERLLREYMQHLDELRTRLATPANTIRQGQNMQATLLRRLHLGWYRYREQRLAQTRDQWQRLTACSPARYLASARLRRTQAQAQLQTAIMTTLNSRRGRLAAAVRHLVQYDPAHRLPALALRWRTTLDRLIRVMHERLTHTRARVSHCRQTLALLDHQHQDQLARGYAMALGPHGTVRDSRDLKPGDTLRIRFARGSVVATVTAVTHSEP